MKPIKHTPYSKTSYLPAKLTYGKFSPTDELLHIIELHQKEINRLQLIITHQFKVVAAFEKENERLQGIVNGQIRARFGRSTEQGEVILDPTDQSSSSIDPPKNKRGAKVGHKGQGRKIPDLPEREVFHEIPHDDHCCKDCGLALQPTALTEDSYTLDIEVRYVRVKHRRERAVRTCSCPGTKFVTAPKPTQIIPKGLFTHAFLAHLLTQKYFFQIPLYRLLLMMQMQGLTVNEGSLVGIFQKLYTLLWPLYEKLVAINKTAHHWHADETGWKNFALTEEKQSFNWWFWIFATKRTVVYVLDSSRSADVPLAHFGTDASGVVSSDRYSAYNKLTRQVKGLTNAFCWAHFRRDFVNAGKGYTFLKAWSEGWVRRIAELYRLNDERLAVRKDQADFSVEQASLSTMLKRFSDQIDAELASTTLHGLQRKILRSARRNWERYIVFLDQPQVPMDNNTAERLLRPVALGRKNYYGSHATWSGEFAALCLSIFQTANLHHLNVEAYMRYILDERSLHPDESCDWESLLPWNIPEEMMQAYRMRCHHAEPSAQQHILGG